MAAASPPKSSEPEHDWPQELLSLRQELLSFSKVVRSELRVHEERQEKLLARLERCAVGGPRPQRPLVISLDEEPPRVKQPPSAAPAEEPTGSPAEAQEKDVKTEVLTITLPEGAKAKAADAIKKDDSAWSVWQDQDDSIEEETEQMTEFRKGYWKSNLGAFGALARWIDWWMELKEPKEDSCIASFVRSRGFEMVCTIVTALNSVLIVYVTNYEAAHLVENETMWVWFVNLAFVVFYSLELLLKISVHRLYFFCNEDASWNIFDTVLVATALLDVLPLMNSSENETATHLRVIRALRILRATKGLRLFRVMRYFSQLRLLLSSVLNSLVSLFWAIVLLAFVLCMFSLTFVQGTTMALMHDTGLDDGQRDQLRSNLGSTQSGMLTLLQVATGDGWGGTYTLVQLTGSWNCAIFLFFIAFVQIAVLNILTGVFVEHAMKLAQPDHDTEAMEKRKEELEEAQELRALIMSMDAGRTGVISEEQFCRALQDEQFRARLALLGLEIRHAELFFESICADFGKREVSIEAFVAGAMRLQGSATALDIQTLTFGTKMIQKNQSRFFKEASAQLESLVKQVGYSYP